MNKIEEWIKKYDKPLTHEQIVGVIYNAFCIIIFLFPITPEIIGFGIYSLKNTFFNAITIVTSITLLILNRKEFKLNLYDKILSVYLLLVVLSSIFTKYGVIEAILGTNGRGEGLITIFSYIATFVIFTKGYKYITKTVKVALIGALIVSIYAIIQANAPIDIKFPFQTVRKEGIATGTMKNQNMLSSYICMFLPAACYYYINAKKHWSLIAVSLLFMALVYSVTLGGYITFISMYVAGVFVSILFSKNRKNTLIRIGIATIVTLGIFFLLEYDPENKHENIYLSQLEDSKEEVVNLAQGSDKFGTGRMETWRRTISVIKNNILLGTGPDSLYPEFRDGNYAVNGDNDVLNKFVVDKAHSEPLHIAATIGLPAAIIYLLFASILSLRLLIVVVKNISQKGINDSQTLFMAVILVSILSYLMQSMINISVVQVAPVFWAILGIGARITLENQTNK